MTAQCSSQVKEFLGLDREAHVGSLSELNAEHSSKLARLSALNLSNQSKLPTARRTIKTLQECIAQIDDGRPQFAEINLVSGSIVKTSISSQRPCLLLRKCSAPSWKPSSNWLSSTTPHRNGSWSPRISSTVRSSKAGDARGLAEIQGHACCSPRAPRRKASRARLASGWTRSSDGAVRRWRSPLANGPGRRTRGSRTRY